MISKEVINEIRQSSDIVEIIGDYLPLVKKGKNFFGVCPFHDDNNPSMSVSPEKQIYTCFSCGATGNVITFVMDYEKISYIEAIKLLADKIGINLNINVKSKNVNKELEIYIKLDKFYKNNLFTSFGKIARDYLYNRKLDDEVIKKFGIGLSLSNKNKASNFLTKSGYSEKELIDLGISNQGDYGIYDVFSDRIMFPLHDFKGNVVAYSGRIYKDSDDSKYVNTKETKIFKKGMILYNYHNAKQAVRTKKTVIIMEGFMDVIRASTIGYDNVIALMGTSVTHEQILMIKKLTDSVYLCFDGDQAGKKATIACGNELISNNIYPKVMTMVNDEDPDSFILNNGKEAFDKLYQNLTAFLDFKINFYKEKYNFSSTSDVSKFIKEIIPELSKLEDQVILELNLKKISNITGVSISTLRDLLRREEKEDIPFENRYKETKEIKDDAYMISEKVLLYYMLNDEDIFLRHKEQLSFFPTMRFRVLFNEMLEFYDKNQTMEIADFISFLGNKKELVKAVGDILSSVDEDEHKDTDLEDLIKKIEEFKINREIQRLKKMMQSELDSSKKALIIQKIADLKIRSEEV